MSRALLQKKLRDLQARAGRVRLRLAYNPDQDRDDDGKWTDEGGGDSFDDYEKHEAAKEKKLKKENPKAYVAYVKKEFGEDSYEYEKAAKSVGLWDDSPGRAKTSRQWVKKLDRKEHNAVSDWVNGDQAAIRRGIAKGATNGRGPHFISAMDKAPVYRGKLYRGLEFSNPDSKKAQQAVARFSKVGSVLRIEAHSGFSKSKEVAKNFTGGDYSDDFWDRPKNKPMKVTGVLLRTRGRSYDMKGFDHAYADEKETIVPKGAKFKITKTKQVGSILHVYMRQYRNSVKLAFDPDQPRDENGRWGEGGGSLSGDDHEYLRNAIDSGYGLDPSPEETARFEAVLDKMPKYEGTTYRGITTATSGFSDKHLGDLIDGKLLEMDRSRSSSKDRDVAVGFAASNKNPIVLVIRGKTGADVGGVSPQYGWQKEVLLRKGAKYEFVKAWTDKADALEENIHGEPVMRKGKVRTRFIEIREVPPSQTKRSALFSLNVPPGRLALARALRARQMEVAAVQNITAGYDPDQPRDESGKWTDEGGGSGSRARTLKEWKSSLSQEEKDAFKSWSRSSDRLREIDENGNLEHDALNLTSKYKEDLRVMHAALKRAPLQTKTIYRGLSDLRSADFESKFKVGSVLGLRSMSSFSNEKFTAERFALGSLGLGDTDPSKASAVLHVRSRGVNISSLSSVPEEAEVLLPKGVAMKVSKVDKTKNVRGGVHYNVYLEETTDVPTLKLAHDPTQLRHPSGKWTSGGTGPEFNISKSQEDALRLRSVEGADTNPLHSPAAQPLFVEMRTHVPGGYAALKILGEEYCRPEVVDLEQLISPQKMVVAAKVRDLVLKAAEVGRLDLAEVRIVKFRGNHFLEDGNHRLAALKLLGVRKVRAPVEDLDTYLADGEAKSPLKLSYEEAIDS